MASGGLKISQDHVWVKVKEDGCLVGISDFAAEALGTIIYVELPEVGHEITKGEALATVESGKASVELPAPVSGSISRVNAELEDQPDLVNQDCFGKGWITVLVLQDTSEFDQLMTKPDYDLFVAGVE
jgi:glycine cleavage system H protein